MKLFDSKSGPVETGPTVLTATALTIIRCKSNWTPYSKAQTINKYRRYRKTDGRCLQMPVYIQKNFQSDYTWRIVKMGCFIASISFAKIDLFLTMMCKKTKRFRLFGVRNVHEIDDIQQDVVFLSQLVTDHNWWWYERKSLIYKEIEHVRRLCNYINSHHKNVTVFLPVSKLL